LKSNLKRPNSGSNNHKQSLSRKDKAILNAASIEDTACLESRPADELLILGLNYLTQAIKTWEQALVSIESAEYMQSSSTLALPNDEHADLVNKLNNLLDNANIILSNSSQMREIKSSQTLQIIESRLALKQQLYADALIKTFASKDAEPTAPNENEIDKDDNYSITSRSRTYSTSSFYSINSRRRLSDDEESFVSACSDVDWLDDELFEKISNGNETNVLYEMGISNVSLGRVEFRVNRADQLNCKSGEDFAAKLFVLRMGFDKIMEDSSRKEWIINQSRRFLGNLLIKADKVRIFFKRHFNFKTIFY
jgi:hypothetical protein